MIDLCAPHIVVSALFAKAGPDSSTFLLDDRSFVGNGLRGTHIANKLLHWRERNTRISQQVVPGMDELMN